MEPDSGDWLGAAFEIYRLARQALEQFRGTVPDDVHLDFCIEELKEELFDLKQAMASRDYSSVAQCMREISMLLVEIQLRSEGNP